jgi:hypothetical protein
LQPNRYPAGWYAINDRLNQDSDGFRVLFLPWHLYMHFGFAQTLMANPAEKFFDKPVLVNNDPEFKDSSPSTIDPTKTYIGKRVLPRAADRSDLGRRIAPMNIKYVILTSDADADNYIYVSKQAGLKLAYRDAEIALYENTAWKEQL